MISVTIAINGKSIFSWDAVNQNIKNDKGETKYITITGHTIWHNRELGAVELAKKILGTVAKGLGDH